MRLRFGIEIAKTSTHIASSAVYNSALSTKGFSHLVETVYKSLINEKCVFGNRRQLDT